MPYDAAGMGPIPDLNIIAMKPGKVNNKLLIIILIFIALAIHDRPANAQTMPIGDLNVLKKVKSQKYFRYRRNSSIIVSGHRGGREKGYPENSLEGFRNVLLQAPAFFEIDPRLTKDSVIVLMHDATLDRTTTAKGFLNEYKYEQLRSVRLKDHYGNVTPYSVPTLEEAIMWSKGKTVLNLDRKDVPPEMIADLITKLNASDHLMLTVHSGEQAKYYYNRLPKIMMSAFIRTMKEFEDIASSGVPWKNIIAYIGPSVNGGNGEIIRLLHSRKVRCMISVAPTHDRLSTPEERIKGYIDEISRKPDIIESDFPVDVWKSISSK
jgi:glycerophosphoryl diester phosphodiesterase